MQNQPTIRLLRLPDVLDRIPVSRSDWYRGMRHGKYPRPVKIGLRSVAWTESSIDALVRDLSATAV